CFQKCEYCQRMGATIPCWAAGCSHLYHFPCAAASGCFQSVKTLRLLCPKHVAEAVQMEDARCLVCDGPGDLQDLVFCTSCGQHYHGACLDITLTPRKRSGWQCPECKVCQSCRQPGEDSMMLVCEACDKGYHTFCMEPAIEGLPTGSWKCKNCRVCSDCGRRPAGLDPGCQWYRSYSVCEGCQQCRAAKATHGAPAHVPPLDLSAQTLESPDCSEPTDVPVPPPESAGCSEEMQPEGNPVEAPQGNGGAPSGEPTTVEAPLNKPPLDELSLNEQPPDMQPPKEPPPLVLPPEDPPPLVLPANELPLERPFLDRPPLEELPPSDPPLNELPLNIPPLKELPPSKPPLEELPPDEMPLDKLPPSELSPNEPPLDEVSPEEPPLDELHPKEPLPSEPLSEEDPKPPGNKCDYLLPLSPRLGGTGGGGRPLCSPHLWLHPTGLLPEVAVAEEAPALAPEVPSEEE
ncbi:KMT2D methyltransferase, partial [Rostratula benghalensis]|nr:KMT2D methyltransferase [Rostratula benghalensis]